MQTLPKSDKTRVLAPHVVILGAGASIASYLHSGRIGPILPAMDNLIETLGLQNPVTEAGFNSNGLNFESFYDDLASTKQNEPLREMIENRVYEYFSQLRLPEIPTIYDYLIASLRENDLIASFNWDPFLLQAYRRNAAIRRLPNIAFLHGSVAVGVCHKDSVRGKYGNVCSKCGEPLQLSRLLYPVKHKNYSADPFINSEWKSFQNHLNRAYLLTVFGYSAPKTDVEARDLMLGVWVDNPTRKLAEIDIIDVRLRDELEKNWEEFFIKHHYGIKNDIFHSYLLRNPRRSCEAFYHATLLNTPWRENKMPQFVTLKELHEWVAQLVAEEDAGAPLSGNPLAPN